MLNHLLKEVLLILEQKVCGQLLFKNYLNKNLFLEEKFIEKGALYKPTSKLHEKLLSKSQPSPAKREASDLKKNSSNMNSQEKKRSNLELFKEELKRYYK
jgi:hypothetical protein